MKCYVFVGSCEQSYGINVARSVDFPPHVVEAAVKNAEKLENFVDKNKYESCEVEASLKVFKYKNLINLHV